MSSIVMNVAEHHDHGDSAPHRHDMVDAHADVVDSAAIDTALADSSNTKQTHKTSYCSACAACCFGAAAPPSSVPAPPTFDTVTVAILPPAVSYTGFIPAGLERPPKHLSA